MKKYPKIVQCDSRGQIVIPKDMRRELGISEGDGFFIYSISDEGLVLKKIRAVELSEQTSIIDELKDKAVKIGIDKKKIDSAVKKYKRDKEGNLEVI